MASQTKNKYSTCVVRNRKNGRVVCYLSQRDIELGNDINYDLMGFEVISL